MNLLYLPHLILIAGDGRNIGKTTLACEIIETFSSQTEIIGLKVTTIYPDEDKFHGKKEVSLDVPFDIFEETNHENRKDTARMLRAGAKRVFYIRCLDAHLQDALDALFKIIDPTSVIFCESGSLRKVVVPGVFIYIEGPQNFVQKDKNRNIKSLANRVLKAGNVLQELQNNPVFLTNDGWK